MSTDLSLTPSAGRRAGSGYDHSFCISPFVSEGSSHGLLQYTYLSPVALAHHQGAPLAAPMQTVYPGLAPPDLALSGLEVAPSQSPIPKPPDYSDLEVHVRNDSVNEQAANGLSYGDHGTVAARYGEQGREGHYVCGWRRRTVWLVVAVMAVALAGIVGGSVGGMLARKSRSDEAGLGSNAGLGPAVNTSIPSTTSTTSSAVSSGSVGFASMDCVNGRRIAGQDGIVYQEYCAEDWPNGIDKVQDISTTTRYSFQACMDACSSYNTNRDNRKDPECLAVTYNADLTKSIARHNANCFLKDAQGTGKASPGSVASAVRTE